MPKKKQEIKNKQTPKHLNKSKKQTYKKIRYEVAKIVVKINGKKSKLYASSLKL